jgi:primase-polymerase (primpol)-like protein
MTHIYYIFKEKNKKNLSLGYSTAHKKEPTEHPKPFFNDNKNPTIITTACRVITIKISIFCVFVQIPNSGWQNDKKYIIQQSSESHNWLSHFLPPSLPLYLHVPLRPSHDNSVSRAQ